MSSLLVKTSTMMHGSVLMHFRSAFMFFRRTQFPPGVASNADRIAAWERVTDRESEQALRRQAEGMRARQAWRERWASIPRHKAMVVV